MLGGDFAAEGTLCRARSDRQWRERTELAMDGNNRALVPGGIVLVVPKELLRFPSGVLRTRCIFFLERELFCPPVKTSTSTYT